MTIEQIRAALLEILLSSLGCLTLIAFVALVLVALAFINGG